MMVILEYWIHSFIAYIFTILIEVLSTNIKVQKIY